MTAVVVSSFIVAGIFGCLGVLVPVDARWALTVSFVMFTAGLVAAFIEEDESQHD